MEFYFHSTTGREVWILHGDGNESGYIQRRIIKLQMAYDDTGFVHIHMVNVNVNGTQESCDGSWWF